MRNRIATGRKVWLLAAVIVTMAWCCDLPSSVADDKVEARSDKKEGIARKEAQGDRREGKDRRLDKGPPMMDLSPEDKEAMKRALQAVWEDPEVMQARDEVKRATEAFRVAIQKAVGKENPRVAALVEKMYGGGKPRGDWEKRRPGGPEGRGGRPPNGKPPGAFERGPAMGEGRGIGPAGFLAVPGDFSEEEKKRLESARNKALQSEAFRQVQKELRGLLRQGEDLRKKRVEMFHRTRTAMIRAMVEADPEVKPLLDRLERHRKVPGNQ